MPFYKIIGDQLGLDTGTFTIKTNTGVTLATGITRLQILAGYAVNVPLGVASITVTSDPANTTCVTNQTYPIPNEGYWEMEKTNVENISDHYGAIQTAYAAPVETFVADDVVGIYTGIVSGTGTWLIKAGPEDIAGTVYNGGGTLIATGANTNSQTTVESGAILQLGYNVEDVRGSVAGTLTVQAGATVDVVGANTGTGRVPFVTLSNAGTVNITGNDACGEGNFRNGGAITNNGLITIDDAKFTCNNPTTITGTGTILVEDGGTLTNTAQSIPATQTLQLNGCGKCSATGIKEGALLYSGAATIASPIQIQSDTCMKALDATTTTFSGVLSGSANLLLGNATDLTNRYGSATFSNAANTFTGDLTIQNTTLLNSHPLAFQYSDVTIIGAGAIQTDKAITIRSLSSTSPSANITTWAVPIILTDNGITTYAGTISNSQSGFSAVTIDGVGNEITFPNSTNGNAGYRALDGAKMSFTGGQGIGQLSVENGSKFTFGKTTSGYINTGTLTMTNNSVIEVQAVSPTVAGRFITYGAFNVTGGYKVDLVEPLVAGTYNILQAAGGGTGVGQIPTIGINNTGLTPTFSWSGQFLRVTLA